MNYEKIAEIIENGIDDYWLDNPILPPREKEAFNKYLLDKIADLFPEKKYKIMEDVDPNNEIKLSSNNNENDVLHEALDILGWSLFEDKD
jgi:hypothetical protein